MAIYGPQEPKSNIGTVFRKQLERMAEHAREEDAAIRNQAPPIWYRPADFDVDLFDIPAYHEPFSREQQSNEFDAAVKNANEAGTVGDLMMVQLQGDLMAAAERAFKARHHSACRTRIQPAGRKYGSGAQTGTILGGMLGYIVHIDRHNKGEPPYEAIDGDPGKAEYIV